MGFDLQTTRFIFEAKATGADFSDVLTLGRQNLHIDPSTYQAECRRFGLIPDPAAFSDSPFAEGLLRGLGAAAPSSLDVSHYEGATHLADMNLPLPSGLDGKFCLVIDGGTLEHVFDFRQAAINIGKLLRVGGHLVSVTCANNFLGHGFYQFSPELFYRAFSPENGFEIETVMLTEVNRDGIWYEVADPAKTTSRTVLVNGARTYIMTRARKVADIEMFSRIPQHSDHRESTRRDEARHPRFARGVIRRLKHGLSDHFAAPHLRKVRSF
jgi:SAM-dependent methyltransferase